MKRLRAENFKKSVSLLREFIRQSVSSADEKRIAGLALEQLQKVTAGSGENGESVVIPAGPHCYSQPRADI